MKYTVNEIDDSLRLIKLGDPQVADIKYGKSKPTLTGSVPVVGSSGVYAYTQDPLINKPTVVVGRKGTAGAAYFMQEPCWPSDTTFYLDINIEKYNPKYLYRFISYKKLNGDHNKTTLPSLKREDLTELEVPELSLKEQDKIVEILDTVQGMVELVKSKIQTSKDLKKTLMSKLFTEGLMKEKLKDSEIGKIPQSWDINLLGTFAKIGTGGTPDRANKSYWDGDIPWVTTGEINYKDIYDTEEKITTLGLKNSAAKYFPKNTILMAMYGQGVTRGRVALLRIEASTNQACASIIPNQGVDTLFLYYYLTYQYEFIRDFAHGANQKNLNTQLIKSIPVPLPKQLSEQKEIANVIYEVDQQINLEEKKESLYAELLYELQHKLMLENKTKGGIS